MSHDYGVAGVVSLTRRVSKVSGDDDVGRAMVDRPRRASMTLVHGEATVVGDGVGKEMGRATYF